MPGKRYRYVLVEDPEVTALVPASSRRHYQYPPLQVRFQREDPFFALVDAFSFLTRKGVGPNAWSVPLSRNPLAFLLDTIEDAVRIVSEEGNVLFQNRAAHGIRFEEADPRNRRAMTFETSGHSIVIEVLYSRSR